MVPAAVKIAICQNRSFAMLAIEIRRPLTRIILESQSRYSFVVADDKRVHQRKPSNPCVIPAFFPASVTKKPHNTLNGPVAHTNLPVRLFGTTLAEAFSGDLHDIPSHW